MIRPVTMPVTILALCALFLLPGAIWADLPDNYTTLLTEMSSELHSVGQLWPREARLHAVPGQYALVERLDVLVNKLTLLDTRVSPDFQGLRWEGDTSQLPSELQQADPNTPGVLKAFGDFSRGKKLPVQIVASGLPPKVLLISARYQRGLLTDNYADLKYVIEALQEPGMARRVGLGFLALDCRKRLVALAVANQAESLSPVACLADEFLPSTSRDGQVYVALTSLHLPSSEVQWMAVAKTAVCGIDGRIVVRAGSSSAKVNGSPVKLSAPPRIEDGRLMISVRDVKPLFGLDYKWDPKLWAVRIFSPET